MQGLYQNASNKFGGPAYFKPMLQTLFEQKALDTCVGAVRVGMPQTRVSSRGPGLLATGRVSASI